jgi:hypothetical protein
MNPNKRLLEEISRFKMMSRYQPGKLINEQLINEEPDYPKPTDTPLSEVELYSVADKELVERDMVRVLNQIIEVDQDEIMSKINVKVNEKLQLVLDDIKILPFKKVLSGVRIYLGDYSWNERLRDMSSVEDKYIYVKRPGISIGDGPVYIGDYYNKLIANDPTPGKQFSAFFEKYKDKKLESGVNISDYVKQQLENLKAEVFIVPIRFDERFKIEYSYRDYEKEFGFSIQQEKTSRKDYNDYAYNINEEIPLDKIAFPKVPVYVGPNRKQTYKIESRYLQLSFGDLVLSIPPEMNDLIYAVTPTPTPTSTPTPTPTPEVIAFDFVVETAKNYEFDKAELTQDAKNEIDKNITAKFLSILPKYQEGYLNFIKDKEIPVYAYASIDADPDYKDGGYYEGCSQYGVGKGPRKLYNKCLSQARAQKVVDYLKTTQGGIFKDVNFKPVGMGETCEFSGLCWKVKNPGSNEKSPYSTSKTYPDRRFSVNFPNYHADF